MKVMRGFVSIYVILSLHTRAESRRPVPGTVSPRALRGPDVGGQSKSVPSSLDRKQRYRDQDYAQVNILIIWLHWTLDIVCSRSAELRKHQIITWVNSGHSSKKTSSQWAPSLCQVRDSRYADIQFNRAMFTLIEEFSLMRFSNIGLW